MENQQATDNELIRLVTSNADISTQYILFRNGEDNLYAINVAKAEELIIYKELDIAKNSDPKALSLGVTKFRENMTTLINFDRWLGLEKKEDEDYELVMVCNYGNHRLGIIIKNVENIISLDPKDLNDNSDKDDKMAFITEIDLKDKKHLCLIFDSDKLLMDLFPDIEERKNADLKNANSANITKKILIAEDSRIIQRSIRVLFEKMKLDYEIFGNGQLLLDYLKTIDPETVGLIISDVEMPVKDGISLLADLKQDKILKKIPVVINTNMANNAIVSNLEKMGAEAIIKKLDLGEMKKNIIKYVR